MVPGWEKLLELGRQLLMERGTVLLPKKGGRKAVAASLWLPQTQSSQG
jgi:hypothetical protein